MGNTQTNNSQNLKSRFTVHRQKTSESPQILQQKSTGKLFALKQFSFNNQESFKQCLANLEEKKKMLLHPNIVIIDSVYNKSQNLYCSNNLKAVAIIQHPETTLQDLISNKKQKKIKFTEIELERMVVSVVSALSYFEKQSLRYQVLKLNQILYFDSEKTVKISDPYLNGRIRNYDALLQNVDAKVYLSPEQVSARYNDSPLEPDSINPYKSDVFVLAMIILEAGLGESLEKCYRETKKIIDMDVVLSNVAKFKQNYSSRLVDILQTMLVFDAKNRLSFIELQNIIQKINETTPQNSQRGQPVVLNSDNSIKTPTFINNMPYSQYRKILFTNQPVKPISFVNSPVVNLVTPRSSVHQANRFPINLKPVLNSNPAALTQQRPISNAFGNNSINVSFRKEADVIRLGQRILNQQKLPQINYGDIARQTKSIYIPVNNTVSVIENKTDKEIKVQNKESIEILPVAQKSADKQNIITKKQIPNGIQEVVEVFKHGSRYEGQKLNGMRHGKGKFYYQDGGYYDGDWKENKMCGKGKLFYQSGSLAYDGEWFNDEFSGFGILYNELPRPLNRSYNYKNFEQIQQYWIRFQGYFQHDIKQGPGKLILSNEEYFQGMFEEDLVNGQGIFYTTLGEKIIGLWKQNKLVESR